MYGHLFKENRVPEFLKVAQEVVDMLFDQAHNTGGTEEVLLEFTQEDWDKISTWEKHLRGLLPL